MQPSDKQLAIYKEWETSNRNILIQAVAGSGKTTTLVEILKRTQGKTLYIAFNKSIQTETQEKFEKNNLPQGKALTLHALGYSALRAAYTKIELSDSKNWDMIKELEKRLPIYFNLKSGFYKNYEEIMKLKFCLIDMNDVSRSYLEDDPDTIFNIMEDMDKSKFDNDNVDLGLLWSELKIIRDEFEQKRPLVIDFNDMIYLPAKYNIYIPIQPKYLLLDEAQDFNLTQHKLIDNLISQGDIEKWIAVGDRNQSIYGFSGAYAESFDLFKSKDNTIELPLDICYRCPVSITKEANKVYDVMIPFKEELGLILTSVNKKILKQYPDALVICRNKRQLIQLYFDLLTMDIPSKIMGDDIKGSIIRFLNSYKKYTIKSTLEDIDSEIQDLKQKEHKTQKQIFLLDSLQENKKILVLLHTNLGIRANQLVSDLIQSFLKIFENNNSSMILCTIHKSKGLEADTVVFLNKDLIPHKFARSPQQLIQERNLLYVALTRAKKNLIYLNLKDYN